MTSSIRTHVWYFTLADCSLERYLHPVPAVHYRAEMRDGDSHLPVDENGLRGLHFFNMVTAFLLVYAVGKRIALAAAGRAKGGTPSGHGEYPCAGGLQAVGAAAVDLVELTRYVPGAKWVGVLAARIEGLDVVAASDSHEDVVVAVAVEVAESSLVIP